MFRIVCVLSAHNYSKKNQNTISMKNWNNYNKIKIKLCNKYSTKMTFFAFLAYESLQRTSNQ